MSQLTLAEIKRYCVVDHDDDDTLLGELQAQAESYVTDYLRRDLDTELPGAWPVACIGAVKLLVATWYRTREDTSGENLAEVPHGVRDLLASHRSFT